MGLFNEIKKGDKEKTKKAKKRMKIIQAVQKFIAAIPIIVKMIIVIFAFVFVITLFVSLIESITSEETPDKVYEELEVEDLSELVEIKGDENNGYYLEFVDDFDEKLDNLIETLNVQEGLYTMGKNDKTLFKDIIKAELVTKFPDLGGKLDKDNENQFQGAIKVRRITPNKEIGELKNTGAGEKVTLDDLNDNDIQEEDREIHYEKGEALVVTRNASLYLKGEYEISGEKISDDGVTEKSRVVVNNIDGVDRTQSVDKGQVVYYKGEYFSDGKNTYVEISKEKDGESMGYVKAISVVSQSEDVGKEIQDEEEEIDTSKETVADENKMYRIAIAAGYNNDDDKGKNYNNELIAEEMTIQVAEKVSKLFEEYGNIKVVQTGSTSENKDGVKAEDRVELSNNVSPDLCVQIYFNDEESGVVVNYEYGDTLSQQLGEILSQKISESLGMENKGITTSEDGVSDYYEEIDSSYYTGYPSVIARAGNLENEGDRGKLKDGGIDKYAQSIVDGCIEYLESSHDDYDQVGVVTKNDTYERINSHIYDLTYVTQDTFQSYIDTGDKKALDVYTLDDDWNLITATWSVENGNTTIRQNSAMNFRTILQKVTTPFEYLLFFLIDSENDDFVQDFAKMIQDTEIVMAVQDNITTTQVTTEVYQCTKILRDENGEGTAKHQRDWHMTSREVQLTETCSTSVSITYANTWFMEYEKGSGYNAEALGLDKDEKVDVIKNVKGTLNETITPTEESGEDGQGYPVGEVMTETFEETPRDGVTIYYRCDYQVYEKKYIETHTITNTYGEEEAVVSGNESKFVDLFNEHSLENYISDTWLWDIIAENEKTASLLDLTKYLIYKATDTDYGITEFDFSIFDLSAFEDVGSSMGGLETFREYLRSWEGNTGITADGTKYIVGDDGAGNPTVGYGIDIYNSGFLDRFLAAGYDVSIGAQIDVAFVDALEMEEIQNALKTVEAKCAGLNLKIYQKYALVSRIYNCGSYGAFRERNGKTFVEAYNSYWNPETDDEYRVPMNDGMYNHPLYTNYMSKPVTSAAGYMQGLENRRKSEWILFKTGYYDRINKWCSESDTGSIVQKAVECHQYLRTNGYTYAQAGVNIPITGNGRKTIDCSSFVSWVLYEAGYEEMKGYQQTSYTFLANKWGWQEVSVNEAQPGDLLVYSAHVEIVAGDAGSKFLVYNCGGNASINAAGTPDLPESSTSGYMKSQVLKVLRPSQ